MQGMTFDTVLPRLKSTPYSYISTVNHKIELRDWSKQFTCYKRRAQCLWAWYLQAIFALK